MNTRKPAFHTLESLQQWMEEEGDCVVWTGPMHHGVPYVFHDGKMHPVRRLIVAWNDVVLERGENVGCRCKNSHCVLDRHFVIRDSKAQAKAMAAAPRSSETARRAKLARMKRETSAKLDMEKAREIRLSTDGTQALDAQYGVHRSLIYRIRKGTAWRDFGSPFAGLGAR